MKILDAAKKLNIEPLKLINYLKEINIEIKETQYKTADIRRSEFKKIKSYLIEKGIIQEKKPDKKAEEKRIREKKTKKTKIVREEVKEEKTEEKEVEDLNIQEIVEKAEIPMPGKKQKASEIDITSPIKKTEEEEKTGEFEISKIEEKESDKKEKPSILQIDITAPQRRKKTSFEEKEKSKEKKKKRKSHKTSYAEKKSRKYKKQYYYAEELLEEESTEAKTTEKKEEKPQKKEKKKKEKKVSTLPPKKRKLIYTEGMTAAEIANSIFVDPADVVQKCFEMGEMIRINDPISQELAEIIAAEFGAEFEVSKPKYEIYEEKLQEYLNQPDKEEDLIIRTPVVTVMGHVDHGKTKLLDRIRKTDVVSKEYGGITQHIGASVVTLEDGRTITFIDTPGHEAFTEMRARGAQVTDIAILVVAANDGVMPQTEEAIDHIKAAGIKMVVAINKIDLPEANPDKVITQLMQKGIIPDNMGGDTSFVKVSALLLEAEILELKANPKKPAVGYVIEVEHSDKTGISATVLIKNGTLKQRDYFIAGSTWGKVRRIINDKGQVIKEVGPGLVGKVYGFNSIPEVGSKFIVYNDEKFVKELAELRTEKKKIEELAQVKHHISLEDLYKMQEEEGKTSLNLIIKSDTQGTGEGILKVLRDIPEDKVKINILRNAVGAITKGDIDLADAYDAIIVGFNVRASGEIKQMAKDHGVSIKIYRTIYDLKDDIIKAIEGKLQPIEKEIVLGEAEIKQVFKVSKVGSVAGCLVVSGKIKRNAHARLYRNGTVIYEGKIASLKRLKDDVTEVDKGYECGIKLENYNDIKVGDIIEAYEIIEEKASILSQK